MPDLTCALGPDSAGTLITAMLRRARSSIDAAVYEVGPSYAWILAGAIRNGVTVRLLLDGHTSDGNVFTSRGVEAAGGACRIVTETGSPAHWKLLVVDGTSVAVGSGNLIWRDAPRDPHGRLPPESAPLGGTREWWVLVTGAERLVTDAQLGFEAAWHRARPASRWRAEPDGTPGRAPGRAPGDVGTPRPQVAPFTIKAAHARVQLVVGGLPVALTIGRHIVGARRRVLVTAPYVHPGATAVRRLIGAVRGAAARGVDSRLLLGSPPSQAELAWLRAGRVPVRCMDPALSTRGHAKGLIADDVAVIASANWSSAGCGANWEAALIVHHTEAAAYYATAWERDWEAAEPLSSRVWGIRRADMLRPCSSPTTPT